MSKLVVRIRLYWARLNLFKDIKIINSAQAIVIKIKRLNKQISKLGFEDYSCEWERYWENVMQFVNKYLYEHKNDVVQLDFFSEMT